MPRVHDTVLLTGWLFADLLLALMVIFFAAVPGAPPPPPPELTANVISLDAKNSTACKGAISNFICTVMLTETAKSSSGVDWQVNAAFDSAIVFTPSKGHLSPGQTIPVTISAISCHNESFTFHGLAGKVEATPAVVSWKCEERLDFSFKSFTLNVSDPQALLAGSLNNDIKQQTMNQPILKGRDVGLAIVSAGAPTNGDIGQAQNMSAKIYDIFRKTLSQPGQPFERASYYQNLYFLGGDSHVVSVDVYLFCSNGAAACSGSTT
jgi:hypothetical protein